MGSANYSWYQAKFLLLAGKIYQSKGHSFITSVNREMPKLAPGQYLLNELLKNPIPLPDLLKRLNKIYPQRHPLVRTDEVTIGDLLRTQRVYTRLPQSHIKIFQQLG